jgi:hypothetical protein
MSEEVSPHPNQMLETEAIRESDIHMWYFLENLTIRLGFVKA